MPCAYLSFSTAREEGTLGVSWQACGASVTRTLVSTSSTPLGRQQKQDFDATWLVGCCKQESF